MTYLLPLFLMTSCFGESVKTMKYIDAVDGTELHIRESIARKSINWTIFIQLLRQHLRYDCDYKN